MPKLFENLWVKIAALILAALLWFHVVTEKVYQNQITLALTQVEIPGDLVLMEPPPESVMVTVSATGKNLLRSDWKRSGTRLLVTGGRPGKFHYDITAENLALIKPELVKLIEVVAPREYTFRCDRLADKDVPIKSRVVIIPDQGYAVSGADSLSPAVARVSGPRSALAQIRQIETEPVRLEGVRNDLMMRSALTYPDIYGLKITPDSVDLHIKVVPIKTRVIEDVAIRLIHPPLNGKVTIEPNTVELRISGAPDVVDNLSVNRLSVTADFIQADSSGNIPVSVVIPLTIKLRYKSVATVRIVYKE